MSKVKVFLGYALAALGLPIALATFMGLGFWSETLASATGLRVSPWVTGDEVARTVTHDGYETRIHKPVFMALIGERSEGFVQVDWAPPGRVPPLMTEDIDYNADGQPDFQVELNTQTAQATVTAYTAQVIGLQGIYRLKDAWAVRVTLKNTR